MASNLLGRKLKPTEGRGKQAVEESINKKLPQGFTGSRVKCVGGDFPLPSHEAYFAVSKLAGETPPCRDASEMSELLKQESFGINPEPNSAPAVGERFGVAFSARSQ